jgi:hypothetical protein
MLPTATLNHLEELSCSPVSLNAFVTVLNKYHLVPSMHNAWIERFKQNNRYYRATEGAFGSGRDRLNKQCNI